jgi:hypothetical protein
MSGYPRSLKEALSLVVKSLTRAARPGFKSQWDPLSTKKIVGLVGFECFRVKDILWHSRFSNLPIKMLVKIRQGADAIKLFV